MFLYVYIYNNAKGFSEKTIYDLKLHEALSITSKTSNTSSIHYTVIRVPGGWIYRRWIYNQARSFTRDTFVPFEETDIRNCNKGSCYIMHRIPDNFVFVTTNKKYADELYDNGGYAMRESHLVDV